MNVAAAMQPPAPLRFAIVGAGMAGLACADALVAQGHGVTLFDKARGAGGRMSTRRLATPIGEASFDHGAQYFTVRDPAFQAAVADWAARDLAQPWPVAGHDAWVGVPAMNAVVRAMAERHDAHFGVMVQGIARAGRGWRLIGQDLPAETFDAVIVAVPAEQAATLLGPVDLAMARCALMARSQPCWTAMYAFAAPLTTALTILRDCGPIGWAARDSAKPGRGGVEAWVVQGNGAWSAQHLEDEAPVVQRLLLDALAEALGYDLPPPIEATAHRWRYAMSAGIGEGALWNARLGVGACGDWLLGPRVESAWLSGTALGAAVRDAALAVA
ncbi:NAD(P)-binding protein [Sphingomonas sp. AR_OL41]|uniref:NAD(P)/FAD-dependent oxidoreductase n=1 Tax=Sphingomonas sp. AR_OL41 TaxID=3042729 RepID=UPI00248145EF|nr:FAD-dependent oxidoreductase [Sphingomonas sp. AR_OL41]MDH7974347.1 NAD(P)-binding protein [Sphingomonas sp. AR_OL41]